MTVRSDIRRRQSRTSTGSCSTLSASTTIGTPATYTATYTCSSACELRQTRHRHRVRVSRLQRCRRRRDARDRPQRQPTAVRPREPPSGAFIMSFSFPLAIYDESPLRPRSPAISRPTAPSGLRIGTQRRVAAVAVARGETADHPIQHMSVSVSHATAARPSGLAQSPMSSDIEGSPTEREMK